MHFGAFKCVFGTKESLRVLEECQDLSSLNVLSAVTGNHTPVCFSVLLHKKALLTLDNLLGLNIPQLKFALAGQGAGSQEQMKLFSYCVSLTLPT